MMMTMMTLDDDDETGSSNIDVNYPESQRMDAEASNSLNSSGNNSSGTLCPQLSPRSTSPTGSSTELLKLDMTNIPKEQRSSQDSEKHIVELITQSSWLQAVKAFKFHKQKWPETFSLDFENHIGILGVEEDFKDFVPQQYFLRNLIGL